MKSYQLLLVSALSALLILQACGNSQQQQQQEQARRDSITQAQQEERARLDSLAQARADSISRELEGQGEQTQKPEKKSGAESTQKADKAGMSGDYTFSADGRYTVQVEAWRNSNTAQKRLQNWKDRGFDRAYISEYGSDQSGDVWYRIRLGYLPSKQQAENLKQHLMSKYDTSSWISLVRRPST